MPIQKTVIFLCLFPFIYTFFTVAMMGIVVILVHRTDSFRDINDRYARKSRKPYHPVVPACTTDHKFRNLPVVKALLKNKIVNELHWSLTIRFSRKPPDFLVPTRPIKVQRISKIYVPP